ncbi:MAG TPA: hypothetical protein VFB13_05470 [Reyranella sp.]|jgi:hypothetical protein|nr:hypothetical protein [Reyranella sp.]
MTLTAPGFLRATHRLIAWTAILVGCIAMLSGTVHAQAENSVLDKLMKKTSIKYTKNGGVYVAQFTGKSLKQFPMLIAADGDTVIMIAVVAEKEKFKKTPELVEGLAMASMDNPLLKVGLVKAGDMVVRVDALIESLDSDDLEKLINKAALGADAIHKQFSRNISR